MNQKQPVSLTASLSRLTGQPMMNTVYPGKHRTSRPHGWRITRRRSPFLSGSSQGTYIARDQLDRGAFPVGTLSASAFDWGCSYSNFPRGIQSGLRDAVPFGNAQMQRALGFMLEIDILILESKDITLAISPRIRSMLFAQESTGY